MTDELTAAEKAGAYDTWRHIHRVQHYILSIAKRLIDRAHAHDQSKLEPPEVGPFSEVSGKLHGITYGSDEYKRILRETLGDAVSHHYAHNRHHPEYFREGVDGMNLLDLLEMVCDHIAAAERHADGDPYRSHELNRERFGYSDQLYNVIKNTITELLQGDDSK